jgi:hypothetical protein
MIKLTVNGTSREVDGYPDTPRNGGCGNCSGWQ